MIKEVSTAEADLEALMGDLEAMLATPEPEVAPVVAAPVENPCAEVTLELSVPCALEPPVENSAVHEDADEPPDLGDLLDAVAQQEATDTAAVAAIIQAATPAVEPPPWEEPAAAAQAPEVIEPEPALQLPDEDDITLPPTPAPTSPAPAGVYAVPTATEGGLRFIIDVPQFQRDTAVSELNLNEAMIQQAGMRAFYNAQAAYAEGQEGRTKAKFEVIEARLYDIHRKAMIAAGEKVTDKAIDSAVKMDPRWLQAKYAVAEAGTIASVNKGLTFAMADRREMLSLLAMSRGSEFKGALFAQNQEASKQSLTDRAAAAGRKMVQ